MSGFASPIAASLFARRPAMRQKINRSNQPFTTDHNSRKMTTQTPIGTKIIDQVKFVLGAIAATGGLGGNV